MSPAPPTDELSRRRAVARAEDGPRSDGPGLVDSAPKASSGHQMMTEEMNVIQFEDWEDTGSEYIKFELGGELPEAQPVAGD